MAHNIYDTRDQFHSSMKVCDGVVVGNVALCADGTTHVYLYAEMVCGKDVTGYVAFDPSGAVTINEVTDSFVVTPLTARVLAAAANRARKAVVLARKEIRRVMFMHQAAVDAAGTRAA